MLPYDQIRVNQNLIKDLQKLKTKPETKFLEVVGLILN